MTRWLIAGGAGMLGTDLQAHLAASGDLFVSVDRGEIDVTDPRAVAEGVRELRPDVIINCAAFTKVDDAETQEHAAAALNGSAVGFLADAANEAGALLVQISTDFVFDGNATKPYEPADFPRPLSAYGRTKLLGEVAAAHAEKHVVLRTSWLFGEHGPNFVEAIRNQVVKGNKRLRVVDDQRGRPTYTPHLAAAIVRVARLAAADAKARGIVHYADAPECSWYDFARAIVEESGANDVEVQPVSTSEFPRPARRPQYSVLSTRRYEELTGLRPESWRDGLRRYLSRRT